MVNLASKPMTGLMSSLSHDTCQHGQEEQSKTLIFAESM
jgi:hypothetical protein